VIAVQRSLLLKTAAALLLAFAVQIAVAMNPARATTIERIVSPGGIEAWLVRDSAVPLVSMEFAFHGGASQDPADKPGVATMMAALLDEGAGDLDSATFADRLERKAIELRIRAGRDTIRGALRTLSDNRGEAFELLRLALNAPRFDAEPVERIRAQMMAGLRRATTSPEDIASRRWWETAFPGHAYGRPVNGSLDSVPTITADDLRTYHKRILARGTLKIGIVGDIDAEAAKTMLDQVFGGLPAKAKLNNVVTMAPQGLGQRISETLAVPQAVVLFGGSGIPREDPDFMAAYVVNHILGGGSFSSRLYREVRETRGLAYSVYNSLVWLDHAALFMGATATRADRVDESIAIISAEIHRMAEEGPTEDELKNAKAYLTSSYALGLDTSTKIATQLVQIQLDDLGIGYIDRRAGLIDAVTLADTRRVAKRLFGGGMLVSTVGPAATSVPAPSAAGTLLAPPAAQPPASGNTVR